MGGQGPPLRERIDGMRRQLSAVEQRVAVEAVKRKGSLDGEIQSLAASINEMQQALTSEVKARVANAHTLAKNAAAMLDEQRSEILVQESQTKQLCDEILVSAQNDVAAFESRVECLARGLVGDRTVAANCSADDDSADAVVRDPNCILVQKALALAAQTDATARKLEAIEKEAQVFESHQLTGALAAIDGEHRRLLQRIRQVKANTLQWLQEGLPEYEAGVAAVRSELGALHKNNIEALNEFESYLLAELELFANAIQQEASTREETDDHLVTVLNEWNSALQKGFATIARN